MARLLKSGEIRKFNAFEDVKAFIGDMEARYNWVEMLTSATSYIGLEDNPICVQQVMDTNGNYDPEVSPDTVVEEMNGTKLSVQIIINGKPVTYPVADTAYGQCFKRLGADCSVLTGLKDSRNYREVYPTDKASILNTLAAYATGSNVSQILVFDEEVRANLSSDYTYVPYSGLLETALEEIQNTAEFVQMENATVDYEYMTADFSFFDSEISANLESAFNKVGVKSEIEAYVSIASSNVGSQAATIYPFVKAGGVKYMIGFPIKMNHTGDASIQKFGENIKQIFTSFSDFEAKLDALENIKILNPADCLYNIGKKMQIAEKPLRNAYEDLDNDKGFQCTGVDIYLRLFDLVNSLGLSDISLMQKSEVLAQCCMNGIERFDMPIIK